MQGSPWSASQSSNIEALPLPKILFCRSEYGGGVQVVPNQDLKTVWWLEWLPGQHQSPCQQWWLWWPGPLSGQRHSWRSPCKTYHMVWTLCSALFNALKHKSLHAAHCSNFFQKTSMRCSLLLLPWCPPRFPCTCMQAGRRPERLHLVLL